MWLVSLQGLTVDACAVVTACQGWLSGRRHLGLSGPAATAAAESTEYILCFDFDQWGSPSWRLPSSSGKRYRMQQDPILNLGMVIEQWQSRIWWWCSEVATRELLTSCMSTTLVSFLCQILGSNMAALLWYCSQQQQQQALKYLTEPYSDCCDHGIAYHTQNKSIGFFKSYFNFLNIAIESE